MAALIELQDDLRRGLAGGEGGDGPAGYSWFGCPTLSRALLGLF